MNKRFKKNYKVDGWPIEDTANSVLLSADEGILLMNKQHDLLKEAHDRFSSYGMDVDSEAPQDHRDFMVGLKNATCV